MTPRGSGLLAPDSIDTRAVAKDGTFVLQRVPPGSYNIHAGYADRDTRAPVWVVRQLDVIGADVEGFTLAFTPSNLIRGHLNWEGGKQEDFSTLTVFLWSTDENSPLGKRSEVSPDGSLLFRNVNEGEYRVSISSRDTACHVKFARVGSTPMVDGKISIHSGADNSLEVGVSCLAPQVDGQVLTSDPLPAAGVFVVLVPELRLRAQSSDYSEARTDQNGHFLLKGIEPGDYKLFSWSSVEEGDWYDADFLKPFEEKGVSVHLEEGDHKRIDLTLIETSPSSSSKP
jgi:hypothetical protein